MKWRFLGAGIALPPEQLKISDGVMMSEPSQITCPSASDTQALSGGPLEPPRESLLVFVSPLVLTEEGENKTERMGERENHQREGIREGEIKTENGREREHRRIRKKDRKREREGRWRINPAAKRVAAVSLLIITAFHCYYFCCYQC